MADSIKIRKDHLWTSTTSPKRNLKLFGSTDSTGTLEYVDLFDKINEGIEDGDIDVTGTSGAAVTVDDTQTITGDKTFTGTVTVDDVGSNGDLTFTETVLSPATSATYSLKSKQLVHTVSGGATEVIPINIPVGAKIVGAQILVSTILAFTTGTEATPTWTASTQQIGATTLAAKNSKVTALYNANAQSPIVSGAVETITLTPDAGTIDSGVVVVVAWYEELTALTNVA